MSIKIDSHQGFDPQGHFPASRFSEIPGTSENSVQFPAPSADLHGSHLKNSVPIDLPSDTTHLVFNKGKVDRLATVKNIKSEGLSAQDQKIHENSIVKKFKNTLNGVHTGYKSLSDRCVPLKITGTLLYTLTIGIMSLVIHEMAKLFSRLHYKNDRHLVNQLWNSGAIGEIRKLELLTAVKDEETRTRLMKETIQELQLSKEEEQILEKMNFASLTKYLLIKHSDASFQLNPKTLHLLDQTYRKTLAQDDENILKQWIESFPQAADLLPWKKSSSGVKKIIEQLKNSQPLELQNALLLSLLQQGNKKKDDLIQAIRITGRIKELSDHLDHIQTELSNASSNIAIDTLPELHESYGLILQSMKYNLGGMYHQVVGHFRRKWDTINRQCQIIKQDPTLHLVDGCHFSPVATWPNDSKALDVFDGQSIEQLTDGIQQVLPAGENPRITVFTCRSGNGHVMATKGVAQHLPDCAVQVADVYNDVLKPADLINQLDPTSTSDDFFNFLIKNQFYTVLKILQKLVAIFFPLAEKKYEKLLSEYIERERPDILVSTIPVLDPIFLKLAKKYDLPLLIVTTDLETRTFTTGLDVRHPAIDYPKYNITVAYDKGMCDGKMTSEIPEALQCKVLDQFGYPMRKQFDRTFSEAELDAIREEFHIKSNERVLLTMIGGNAGKSIKEYAEDLSRLTDNDLKRLEIDEDHPVRMICLCGDDSSAIAEIDVLNQINKNIRFTAIPRTPKIPQLASVPQMNGAITKPGGSFTNEMIKKKVPMIFHSPGKILPWEQGNQNYAVSIGLGHVLNRKHRNQNDFVDALEAIFRTKKQIDSGELKLPESNSFGENLRKWVREASTVKN